jgi:hypothetical protein
MDVGCSGDPLLGAIGVDVAFVSGRDGLVAALVISLGLERIAHS